jgi:hypothetical protein
MPCRIDRLVALPHAFALDGSDHARGHMSRNRARRGTTPPFRAGPDAMVRHKVGLSRIACRSRLWFYAFKFGDFGLCRIQGS